MKFKPEDWLQKLEYNDGFRRRYILFLSVDPDWDLNKEKYNIERMREHLILIQMSRLNMVGC